MMDGKSTRMIAEKNPEAEFSIGPQAFIWKPLSGITFAMWLEKLLNVERLLEQEIELARRMNWSLDLREEMRADGSLQYEIIIEAPAEGNFANNWCRDKTIRESDIRCSRPGADRSAQISSELADLSSRRRYKPEVRAKLLQSLASIPR